MFVHPLLWSLAFNTPQLRLSGCRPRPVLLLPQLCGCIQSPGIGFSNCGFLIAELRAAVFGGELWCSRAPGSGCSCRDPAVCHQNPLKLEHHVVRGVWVKRRPVLAAGGTCCVGGAVGLYPALLSKEVSPSVGNPLLMVLCPFFCEGKQTLTPCSPLQPPKCWLTT